MAKEQPGGPLIPLDLLRRVDKYFQQHLDDEPVGELISAETMEPITIKKDSTADAGDIEIDWIPCG